MSTTAQALLINAVVLVAVLEADLGRHRKVGVVRVLRPVVVSATIVPFFFVGPATTGTGLTLEVAGTAAGLVLGLAAGRLLTVYRSPRTGRVVSRAGVAYAGLWLVVVAARSAFSIGADRWFGPQLGRWMLAHQVNAAAITDTLILMAVMMMLARTASLVIRARALPALAPAPAARLSSTTRRSVAGPA
jgi:hypothetical protein